MARILVVDDEQAIRDLIVEILSKQKKHTFDHACDGLEALQLLRSGKKFDLVITDRNMPKMTGIQLLQLVRADPKLKDLKVMVCTTGNMVDEVDEAFAAGANDYVLKPLNIQKLTLKVDKALGVPMEKP